MAGDAPVYHKPGGEYMWIDASDYHSGDSLVAKLKTVDITHNAPPLLRLKFALMSSAYPSEMPLEVDTLRTRFGTSYRIEVPGIRQIEAVDVHRRDRQKR